MALSREAILSASDLSSVEVSCPEWGGSVFVKMMTGSDRDRWESTHFANPTKDVRARLAVFTVCDEAGNPLFTETDLEALGRKSVAPLQRIFNAALKLNRISKSDVDELEKNSGAIPSDSSPSA